MKDILIGIDIGGTNTEIGILDSKFKLLKEVKIKTAPEDNADEFLKVLTGIIETESGTYNLKGIGVAAPGASNLTGEIHNPANLNWKTFNIKRILEERFKTQVSVMNDASAAALGEAAFGEGKRFNSFLLVTLGTGLGAGLYLNGAIYQGFNGLAGEMGHIPVIENGRECKCGKKGCLETYVSATGLLRTAEELRNTKYRDSRYQEINLTGKKIYELAMNNDSFGIECFEHTGKIFGIALSNIVALLDPEAIILFGGLTNSGNLILKPTEESLKENLLNIYKKNVQLLLSKNDNGNVAIKGVCKSLFTGEADIKISA